jgi:hypothetical protein
MGLGECETSLPYRGSCEPCKGSGTRGRRAVAVDGIDRAFGGFQHLEERCMTPRTRPAIGAAGFPSTHYVSGFRGSTLPQIRHVVRMGKLDPPQKAQVFEPQIVCFGSVGGT